MFVLDSRITASSFPVVETGLCHILLKDESQFPWVILVPKVPAAREIYDLTVQQQMELMREITRMSQVLNTICQPEKINIGMLGNIVNQLHVHVIARYSHDLVWPHSVWQANIIPQAYSENERKKMISALKMQLDATYSLDSGFA